MASVYGHIRVAQAALRALPAELERKLRAQEEAYCMGSQGPDFALYPYLRPGLSNAFWRDASETLHGDGFAAFLRAAMVYAIRRGRDATRAYLLGYVTHHATDAAVHPYILSRCPDTERHVVLEGVVDHMLMRMDGETRGYDAMLPKLAADVRKEIAAMFAEVLPEVYGISCEAKQIEWLLCDVRRTHRLLRDRAGVKRALLSPIAGAVGLRGLMNGLFYGKGDAGADPLNLERAPWQYPPGAPVKRDSVCDLLDQAAERSARDVRAVAAALCGGGDIDAAVRAVGDRRMRDGEPGAA